MLTGLLGSSVALAAPRDPVKFAVSLEQMRAHYTVSLLSYGQGQRDLAAQHIGHPRAELYPLIKGDLDTALRTRLLANMAGIEKVLSARGSSAALSSAVQSFNTTADRALLLLDSSQRSDSKFNAQVVSSLLKSANDEYGGAFQAGKLSKPTEYQDAVYYLERAGKWFEGSASRFPADQGGQTRTALQEAVKLMKNKGSVQQLQGALGRARSELAEISGVALVAGSTRGGVDEVIAQLKAAQTHYKGGMSDMANEALISAYLDHFEALEAPLAAKDKALEVQLEATLKTELRALIRGKASASVFSAAIKRAIFDLQKARGLL